MFQPAAQRLGGRTRGTHLRPTSESVRQHQRQLDLHRAPPERRARTDPRARGRSGRPAVHHAGHDGQGSAGRHWMEGAGRGADRGRRGAAVDAAAVHAPAPVVVHRRGAARAFDVIVVWADTRPGFDPYGWLVWGHQTIVGSLDTNAAPSWKPLPYLFTVPFALFGHYQVWLWMIASLAVSLSGVCSPGGSPTGWSAPDPSDVGGVRRRRVRRSRRAGDHRRGPGLLALPAQRPVGPDDRRAVPRRDRLPPQRAAAVGVRARRAGVARTARGVAVPRACT